MTSRRKLKTGIFSGLILLVATLLTSLTLSQDAVDITVFVDRDALTVYLPEQGIISLEDAGFYAHINGQDRYFYLADYGAFGLPFASIPTPICFNLLRNSATVPLPIECDPAATITQRLNAGNIFWFDGVAGNFRTLLIVRGLESVGICTAGSTSCGIAFPQPTATPTLTVSNTAIKSVDTATPTATLTPIQPPGTPIHPVDATITAFVEQSLAETAVQLQTDAPTLTMSAQETLDTIATATQRVIDSNATVTQSAVEQEVEIQIALLSWESSSKTNDDWAPLERDFDGILMMLVPPGCFMMGSEDGDDDEKPVHEVCIEDAFWIDKTEITNAQYNSTGCESRSSEPDQPRNCVTWFEARDFCEARGGRLPTEAEWEYAARGTDSLIYPWGDNYVAANVIGEDDPTYGSKSTAPVGSSPNGASWVGALDLSGNVWEWTNSLYEDYPYKERDEREADTGVRTDVLRVLRGGSFDSTTNFRRTANRYRDILGDINFSYGFRCVRDFE